MQNTDMTKDPFAHLKEIVGKPIENVSQLSEFVRAFNKAGVEVSCGTSRFRCFTRNGEDHVSLNPIAGFDSKSWSRRGTTITCEADEHDGYIYRLSESAGFWFQFEFSLNCIVTDIQWDASEEYLDNLPLLPSIVVSRFSMPLSCLFDEEKRRAEIIKSLESDYDAEVKGIGQLFSAPSENIHIVSPDYEKIVNLPEAFYNNFAVNWAVSD